MKEYKILFTGTMGAGKTTAIGSISEIAPVVTDVANSDDALSKARTTVGLDFGQPWGEFGELRLGWSRVELDNRLLLLSGDVGVVVGSNRAVWTENALRARAVVDQLDYANFPQSGYRGALEFWLGRRTGALRECESQNAIGMDARKRVAERTRDRHRRVGE